MGDHLWLEGTAYGAVDGSAGLSTAAIDGLAGPVVGDHRWLDR